MRVVVLSLTDIELCRRRSEASQQLQERSHFFSNASHDFGQRLHAIKLLTHNAMTIQEQTQYRCLKALSRAVEDLQLYVRNVLEFARVERRVTRAICDRRECTA